MLQVSEETCWQFSYQDPTFQLVPDPDPVSDPT
jgi:hypothetical protein